MNQRKTKLATLAMLAVLTGTANAQELKPQRRIDWSKVAAAGGAHLATALSAWSTVHQVNKYPGLVVESNPLLKRSSRGAGLYAITQATVIPVDVAAFAVRGHRKFAWILAGADIGIHIWLTEHNLRTHPRGR